MKSTKDSQNKNEVSEEGANKNTLSIDEFFRQLEAKEKDLDISSELVIEIEDADADSGFSNQEMFMTVSDKSETAAAIHSSVAPNMEEALHLKNQILNLQNQVSKLENERVEMFELSRRRQTDFENYKKRTERDRSDTFRHQISNLATQMLPVLDNLNRALDSASSYEEESPNNFQQFFEGIMLVNQQLSEVLEEMGVQQITAVGQAFDPHFHEAVATEETDDFPPYTITAELLRGYRIDDKVIRPSMVKVSSPVKLTPADASPAAEKIK